MTNKTSPLVVGLPKNLELYDMRRGLVARAKARIDTAEKQLGRLEGKKISAFEKQLLTSCAGNINVARTCLINLDGDPFMPNESFLKSHDLLVACIVHAQICLASMAGWHGSARSSARTKAKARHLKDPKTAEKMFVKDCWERWQESPAKYQSKAAFARDMLDKVSFLSSTKKIEDWCREWEKEKLATVTMPAE